MTQIAIERVYENTLGRFAYQVSGPEGAPAVVFSHGVAMDHRTFDSQVQALQQEYRVITWDMPFHGGSDAIDKDVPFSSVSTDLLADIVKSLGVSEAVFAGLSLGSTIVQQMSARHPEMVRAEIHISGSSMHPKMPAITKLLIPIINAILKFIPEDMMARTFAKNKALTKETIAYLIETVKITGKDALIHLMTEIVRDMAAGLPAPPDKPRLIVYGDHEQPFVIKAAKKWHQRLPGSELVEIENAHHILNQDNPDAFNKILLDFLSSVV